MSDAIYDIAVSYASEQRPYVKDFVSFMRKKKLRVYFDIDEQARMLGTLLHEELSRIYSQESLVRVIFLSEEYVKKPFTKLESEIILAEYVFQKHNMFIIKFDDVTLPGLNRNVVYASDQDYPEPGDFAKLVYNAITHTRYLSKTTLFDSIDHSLHGKIKGIVKERNSLKFVREIQKQSCIFRILKNDDILLYLQISKDLERDLIFVWLYGKEPMDKNNTHNGLIYKENNCYYLINRGIIDTLESQIHHESLDGLIESLSTKILIIIK